METLERQKGKSRPVLISTLSTAVAMGVAYVMYNRRSKEEDITKQLSAPPEQTFRLKNILPFRKRKADVYKDDSDIGYC